MPSNRKTKIIKFIISLLLVFVFLVMIITIFKKNGYILNNTSSFPIGIYQVKKQKKYQRGDLVSFCAPLNETVKKLVSYGFAPANTNCDNSTPVLLKKIVALEGDKIEIQNNAVYINHILQPKSKIYLVGRMGNTLEKQLSQNIKANMFWAMSDYNIHSYDSRYYGQVPLTNIIGKAHPILIWGTVNNSVSIR